ncbi:MAG TPA: hypothetical protein DCE42_23765, partial [Myxococcales bacterium]|nr:hypothetical protein [Myxococcales bacterium]
ELPKLVCSEAITPPPEVEFNYMLPKQRSAGSKQSDTEVQKKEELFIVPEDVILLQRQLIEPIYQGSISTLKQALDRGLSLPLATKQLDMGIVFDLVLNDVHERYALATLEKKAIPDAILFYQHERKRIAGVMTNEEREFYEQKLLPPEQTPSKQQDKEAEKDEQTWAAVRFAWLLEMFLEHGYDMGRLHCENKLQPPPEAAIDYNLPTSKDL